MAATRQRSQLHKELILLRLNAGLSREDLAGRIGISRETIRQAERGHIPGERAQIALAAEFKQQVADLWPFERQRERLLCRRG